MSSYRSRAALTLLQGYQLSRGRVLLYVSWAASPLCNIVYYHLSSSQLYSLSHLVVNLPFQSPVHRDSPLHFLFIPCLYNTYVCTSCTYIVYGWSPCCYRYSQIHSCAQIQPASCTLNCLIILLTIHNLYLIYA